MVIITISLIWVTIFLLLCMLLVRGKLVGDYRLKLLNKMYDPYKTCIERGLLYKMYHATSYDKMLFDFRKWTFKQFYGDV